MTIAKDRALAVCGLALPTSLDSALPICSGVKKSERFTNVAAVAIVGAVFDVSLAVEPIVSRR